MTDDPQGTDDERVQRVMAKIAEHDEGGGPQGVPVSKCKATMSAIRREFAAVRHEERRAVLREVLGGQLVDGDEHICPNVIRWMLAEAGDAETPAEGVESQR